MGLVVRTLLPAEAEAYVALRREMLVDAPFAFLASPGDDFASDPNAVREALRAAPTFGAFDPALVGTVGLIRERHAKSAHKANVWGMYVTPRARRRGVGRLLMEAAVAHARSMAGVTQVTLSVSDATPGARALYESLGFRVWGTEPRAMRVDGRAADEHHMVLMLDGGP